MNKEESEVMRIAKKKDFNQGAYIQAYMKQHYKRVQLLLNVETDADIIEWLREQPNISAYLKRLIVEDMKSK